MAAKDKAEEMAEKMKVAAEEVEETIASASTDPSQTVIVTSEELAEMRQQQQELMAMLQQERTERKELAKALAQVQPQGIPSAPAPNGQPVVLLEGREWGPFAGYEFVTTPFGEYAVPIAKVLHFEGVNKVNRETLQLELVPYPVYREATEEERKANDVPEMKPLNPNKIKPPVSVEEAMQRMVDYLEGRAAPKLTPEPVVPVE